jgi:hypothetical protein
MLSVVPVGCAAVMRLMGRVRLPPELLVELIVEHGDTHCPPV